MDITSLKTVKDLLKQHGIRPSKGLGQNFLVDKGAVKKVVEAASIQPEETILEIGPGLGVLTQELAARAKKVIAVEKDRNMVEILKKTLRNYQNVEIIQGDIRNLTIKDLNFKIVGNLPFYLTAPVIRQFLELVGIKYQPTEMVLMVQKEVAQRICAKPPDMNLLAVSVQFYAEPKIVSYISKNSFWPSPEVNAAVIKITPKPQNIQRTGLCMFFKVVKAGFSQPRKQLANNLSKKLNMDKKKVGEWLLENNIQPSQRAETLTLENWLNLAKNYKMDL